MTSLVHGYSTYVNHSCRCEVCKAGSRDYWRGRRAREKQYEGIDWQDRAECLHWDPELFFTEKDRSLALHVCRSHCPVVRKCLLWSRRVKTYGAVQGGVVWTEAGKPSRDGHIPDRTCDRCKS